MTVERTEQDALELARKTIKHYGAYPSVRDKETSYILASALLSLAAERDELRAENERLRAEKKEVLFSGADGILEMADRLNALESRYSELESAARSVVDLKNTIEMDALSESQYGDEAAVPTWRDEAIDALGAALDSLISHPQGTPHDPSEGVQE